jgi:hypothetical protein
MAKSYHHGSGVKRRNVENEESITESETVMA